MASLPIAMAFGRYDRTQALADGRVHIQGCEPTYFDLDLHQIFFRTIRNNEFDVSELSFSSYMAMAARGDAPYVAIPVFLSRMFRHSAIYVRRQLVDEGPTRLKGARVGVPEYQITAAVAARGLLEDEYGVSAKDVQWFTGGLEEAGRTEKVRLNLPEGIDVRPIPADETLSGMLLRGELDAVISPLPPVGFSGAGNEVCRLFPDYREQERRYFLKTGIWPIMHVVVIRSQLVDVHPWIANVVYDAFLEAKSKAMTSLASFGAAGATHPWIAAEVEGLKAMFGEDWWPYGIAANRVSIEAATRWHHAQGLSDRQLSFEDLFAGSTLDRALH